MRELHEPSCHINHTVIVLYVNALEMTMSSLFRFGTIQERDIDVDKCESEVNTNEDCDVAVDRKQQ